MKTSHAVRGPRECMVPQATISYLHSADKRAATDAERLRLPQALAHVERLKRALASSQQEMIAAQRQVDLLTRAYAQGFEARREHEFERSAPPCPTWNLTDFCLIAGPDAGPTPSGERILTVPTRIRKGAVLYRVGDSFDALYAIRFGSCKTVLLAESGREQVVGYHMAGEVVGIDGVASESHECQATALEDMEICRLPFGEVERLARLSHQFGHGLHKLLSQESARAYSLLLIMGTMRADQRLAYFLLDLSQRYQARGYSSCEFVLRMTRQEIGSYLGLKLETVSRLLSRFHREGLLEVEGRTVKLLDRIAVSQLVDCGA
jgi:CRP/FNR family transcriptional regulator, anaerobic regulatory protein